MDHAKFHFASLSDDQQRALFASVDEVAGRELTPGDAASTEKLMRYWAEGEGAAKIGWGVAGDFARCESHLGKYVGPTVVKGLCANLHHRATGAWPGHAPSEQEAAVADTEHPVVHETISLSERATPGSAGRWQVKAITAGLGSSGYYSPQVLEAAAKDQLIKAGTPLFFDHASESERTDRPERSVKDIAAVFTSPASYDARNQALVGEVQVFGPYRELVAEMAPHIGLSISGSATDITEGMVDGRRVKVIEGLHSIGSVDLVTKAGRGGAFTSLLESARTGMEALIHDDPSVIEGVDTTSTPPDVPATRPDASTTESQEENQMGTKQIEESEFTRLTEAAGRVDTLEAELKEAQAKLAEATKTEETGPVVTGPRKVVQEHIEAQDDRIARLEAREAARAVIGEVLAEAWIGESQKARLTSALMESLPMKEGKLDEDTLRQSATDRVNEAETEAAEILSSAGVGTPRGLGALTTPATEAAGQKFEDELRESFIRRGLSKDAAEFAVKGH